MQVMPFQAIAICIVLLTIAQFVWRQLKTGEMPFRRYWFVYAVGAWCAGVFLYGILFVADHTIHENTPKTPCPKAVTAEFCGRDGTPHTQEEARAFALWLNTLILSWLVWFPTIWIAGWVSKRRKAASPPAEP
jgi:Trk-type K+ transport system membrane component